MAKGKRRLQLKPVPRSLGHTLKTSTRYLCASEMHSAPLPSLPCERSTPSLHSCSTSKTTYFDRYFGFCPLRRRRRGRAQAQQRACSPSPYSGRLLSGGAWRCHRVTPGFGEAARPRLRRTRCGCRSDLRGTSLSVSWQKVECDDADIAR